MHAHTHTYQVMIRDIYKKENTHLCNEDNASLKVCVWCVVVHLHTHDCEMASSLYIWRHDACSHFVRMANIRPLNLRCTVKLVSNSHVHRKQTQRYTST
jgi:hypothetical protein